jgi:SH3-like domain-containing protein
MIYSRRGDTGDGGISWSYANEGNPIRVVRDTENPL